MNLLLYGFALVLGFSMESGRAQANPGGTDSGRPWAQLQILCGANPHPVSLSIGGQELFQGLKAGSWINDLNIAKRELVLRITKTGTQDFKDFEFSLDQGKDYVLCLLGDFQPLPPVQGKDGKMKPDFRIQALLLPNAKPGATTVNVRAINGLSNRAIELSRSGSVLTRVEAGKVGTVLNQPADLLMYASDGRSTTDLPMAQKTPVANITLLFYESDGRMAVKAMLERTEAP